MDRLLVLIFGILSLFHQHKVTHLIVRPLLCYGLISEIKVNKPGNIPFEDLEIGKKYNLTWNDGGSEENEDIKIVDFDSDDTENWAMIDILTDVDKWEEKTGSEPGE